MVQDPIAAREVKGMIELRLNGTSGCRREVERTPHHDSNALFFYYPFLRAYQEEKPAHRGRRHAERRLSPNGSRSEKSASATRRKNIGS